jgi:hypothetical protein
MKKYIALFLVLTLLIGWTCVAQADLGPTLTASVSISATCDRVWQWDISKTATPDWKLFTNDEAVSHYTVTVTKTGHTDNTAIAGSVSVTNPSSLAALNFGVTVTLYADNGSGFAQVDQQTLSTPAQLPGNTTGVYPYSFSQTGSPAANYKVTAAIKAGPTVSASGASSLKEENATVHVTDTWKGDLGAFSDSGVVNYDRTFAAGEAGKFDNTATIVETNQSSSASINVKRYSLDISKTAAGSYDRKYTWTINKVGDQTAVKVIPGQTVPVNYKVTVTAAPTDSNFKASGVVTITNNTPIDATINSVSDIMTGGINVTLNTTGITFPYTLKSGAALTLPYSTALPDKTARTNTATALQQNYRYSYDASVTKIGTTSLIATANVAFGDPTTVIDGSATVVDDLKGTLGTVLATASPAVFNYPLNIGLTSTSGGGYKVVISKALTNCENTNWKVTNTATLTTCDTHTVLKSSWTVTVTKGTVIGTYTICYWKSHTCSIGNLLPIYLGTQGGCKTIKIATSCDATKYLSMSEGCASNGIVKLYAQLLAAKLNIKNGADGTVVASTISAADAFLAKNNINSWSGLSTASKNQVLSWVTTLDNYNNGVIGPGHAG